MTRAVTFAFASLLALSVAGCSTMKRATGQLDDSVLPGQRENVLPTDQQTARDPQVTGGREATGADGIATTQCASGEPNCVPTAQPQTQVTDATGPEDPAFTEPPAEQPVVKKPAPKKVAAKKKPVKKKKKVVKKPTPPAAAAPDAPAEPTVPAPDAPSGSTPTL